MKAVDLKAGDLVKVRGHWMTVVETKPRTVVVDTPWHDEWTFDEIQAAKVVHYETVSIEP